MSEIKEDYNWQEANPSEEIALPYILSSVFGEDSECGWLAKCTYAREEMLVLTEEMYRQQFPQLFNKLTELAVVRASSALITDYEDRTMPYYYRGAAVALRALEASNSAGFSDLRLNYTDSLDNLDMIDLTHWLNYMRASTYKQTEQLIGFIEVEYEFLPTDPEHLKTAMQIGARNAYILIAHNDACIKREKEIAWNQHNRMLLDY